MNNYLNLLLILLTSRCTVYADKVPDEFDATVNDEAYELDYGYYPYRTYQTTELTSPAFRRAIDSPACYDNLYTFYTPRGNSVAAPGASIVDNYGDMVWGKSTDGQAYDLVVQDYKGEKVLTYWIGDDRIRGHGQGDYYMFNSSYHQIAKISAVGNLKADLHEMVLTPEGTALMTIYQTYKHDLTDMKDFADSVDDPNYIWDCLVQEVDVATGRLMFQWRASEHHSINESFRDIGGDGTKSSPFDWYHMNSIQKDELGNYLISARYTHTITYINGTTGDVIWILGGKRNSFMDLSDGLATRFAFQHDARFHTLDTFPNLLADEIQHLGFDQGQKHKDGVTTQLVTMFDNSASDTHSSENPSHGLLLEISYPSVKAAEGGAKTEPSPNLFKRWAEPAPSPGNPEYTVRLIRQYDHPDGIISSSQGSLQVVPHPEPGHDPKVLLGYGYNAVYTEYEATGEPICDNRFATHYSWERGDVQSYRTFKFPWVGHPTDPPTTVLGDNSIFVSWNGATEVKTWILQQSEHYDMHDDTTWTDVARVEKRGFETEIEFDEDTTLRYLRVRALDVNGHVIGCSRGTDQGWSAGLTSAIPKVLNSSLAPLKLIMLFACNVTALLLLYEGYKQFFAWRRNRAWRQYKSVRLNSDA